MSTKSSKNNDLHRMVVNKDGQPTHILLSVEEAKVIAALLDKDIPRGILAEIARDLKLTRAYVSFIRQKMLRTVGALKNGQ